MKIIRYDAFYRKWVTRLWARMKTPVLAKAEDYLLPKASAIHYIPENSHEFGIDLSHSLMRNIGDRALVYHIESMEIVAGKARQLSISPENMMRAYHKKYRTLIRVRNIDKSNINDRLHMVVNYALLPHLNIQMHSNIAIYQEWANLRNALWKNIEELGPERFHFIPFKLPKFLPGRPEFIRFSKEMTVMGLKSFHTNETFDLLELWKILESVSQGGTAPLSEKMQAQTHFVFIESGHIVTIRMLDLMNWAKEQPDQILRTYYVFLDTMLSLRTATDTGAIVKALTGADETAEVKPTTSSPEEGKTILDTTVSDGGIELEEDKEEHELEKDVAEQAQVIDDLVEENEVSAETPASFSVDLDMSGMETVYKSPIEERIEERALAGSLSGAEQRGLKKLAERYKTLPNPFNPEETLADVAVKKEDVIIPEEPLMEDKINILDKSMLFSKVSDFDTQYIEKVHHKDMLNAALSIQNGGVIVKDVKVQKKNTVATQSETYSIQVQPIAGKATTVKFTVPTLREDGTFLANGVKYRMDKLRVDLPIAKVKPHTVALTSYYGKSFIVRNQNASTNFARWIKNKVMKSTVDPDDNTITEVSHGINDFKGLKLPRVYTAVAEELNHFSTEKYTFFWNYAKRDSYFTAEELATCEKLGLTPCGRSTMTKAILLGMDDVGAVYEIKAGVANVLGSLPSVINPEWGEGPMEYAEIGIFNRRIPIILALIYKKGLDQTFKELGIQYTRIPPTARYPMTAQTYRLKFKDESFIIDVRDLNIRLLIAGFNAVRKNLSDYNSNELNKRSSFNYLLSGSGITQHHLRELLLMYDMFVDPITKELLEDMNEPTTFDGLLRRANEMLVDDWTPAREVHRFRGYERFAGMAYAQIVNSMRSYRAKGNMPDAEVNMNPSAVWLDIIQDQSITLIEESNPIHNAKEKEAVTFSGQGGRSAQTMVKTTRAFHEMDLGVISEATPDSGKVGVRTYMSSNPNIVNVRGIVREFDPEKDGTSSLLSTSAMLAPAANHDDK